MKCREKNPGNAGFLTPQLPYELPSMKCREKNPGNLSFCVTLVAIIPLNEVPGKESRQ